MVESRYNPIIRIVAGAAIRAGRHVRGRLARRRRPVMAAHARAAGFAVVERRHHPAGG